MCQAKNASRHGDAISLQDLGYHGKPTTYKVQVDTIRHRWEIYRSYDDLKDMFKVYQPMPLLSPNPSHFKRRGRSARPSHCVSPQVFRKLKPDVVLPDFPARVLGSCNEWVRRDRVGQLQECINAIVSVYCPAVLDMLEACARTHAHGAHFHTRALIRSSLNWQMDVSIYQELNGEEDAILSWQEKSKAHLPPFRIDIHNHTKVVCPPDPHPNPTPSAPRARSSGEASR